MARKSNDAEDIIFLFRFAALPYRNIWWAAAYVGISIIYVFFDWVFIEKGMPANLVGTPFETLLNSIFDFYRKRLMWPAVASFLVGMSGVATCAIRDWLSQHETQ